MLPRSKRLKTKEFNDVMEKGRVVHSSLFVLRYLPSEKATRVSAVVPIKIGKNAVERSGMRRRIYESVDPLFGHFIQAFKGIVFAKNGAMDQEFSTLSKEIRDLFVKAGLLK